MSQYICKQSTIEPDSTTLHTHPRERVRQRSLKKNLIASYRRLHQKQSDQSIPPIVIEKQSPPHTESISDVTCVWESWNATGMIDVMSTIVGWLPPKCIDEMHGKVMRTGGVGGGILKTATAIKPQLMTLLPMSVFLYAEQKTLEFAHKQIRESKRRKKKKASRDHQGGSKF